MEAGEGGGAGGGIGEGGDGFPDGIELGGGGEFAEGVHVEPEFGEDFGGGVAVFVGSDEGFLEFVDGGGDFGVDSVLFEAPLSVLQLEV